MADPISGSIAKVGGTGQVGADVSQAQEQLKQSQNQQKFEAALQDQASQDMQVKNVLETSLDQRVDKMPHTEKVRLEREVETRVMKMDRADQHQFFAERVQESEKAYFKLQENATQVPDGPMKNKMLESLDNYSKEFGEMNGFLEKMSGGHEFSQRELLAFQLRSHQIVQSVEILSKTVEQSVSGMKTIFQTNV